jgi:hypothetical protein
VSGRGQSTTGFVAIDDIRFNQVTPVQDSLNNANIKEEGLPDGIFIPNDHNLGILWRALEMFVYVWPFGLFTVFRYIIMAIWYIIMAIWYILW